MGFKKTTRNLDLAMAPGSWTGKGCFLIEDLPG
jgi:hypothetical protein